MQLRISGSPVALACALFLPGLLLAFYNSSADVWLLFQPADGYDPARLLLEHSTLPRLVTALAVGAALGLSGALLQQVLRNPLASPTTLGTSAGANLALALCILFFPMVEGLGRDTIAIAGAALSACAVLAAGNRKGASPLSFILSGLMIGLWCSSLSAVLVLLDDRYLSGLFIWGAGSLALYGWATPLSLLPKLAICACVAGLLARPIALMQLGDTSAQASGISVRRVRNMALALAVVLSALATSAVGVIGFIGLVAPAMARLAGARRLQQQLVWSPVIGAGLLFLTDEGVKLLSAATGAFLPTGAMTALFGAPAILLLMTRLKAEHRSLPGGNPGTTQRPRASRFTIAMLVLVMMTAVAVAILVGRAPDGQWEILPMADWAEILPFRWPRIMAALSAAVLLGGAGVILQRLTGNEMASPELVGISAGATGGMAAALFALTSAGLLVQSAFAALGALVALAVMLLMGARSGFSPERMLLTGVVLTAMLDAITGFFAASGDPGAMLLISWMSGSTYRVGPAVAQSALVCATVLAVLALCMRRWLDVLPLGPASSSSIGVSVPVARASLLVLVALMTAVATLVVGPLSFVGLVGPHLARQAGFRRAAAQLAGGAMAAGFLMLVADWLGRVIIFPYQLPAGLIAVLIGAPLLFAILTRDGVTTIRKQTS